MAADDARSKYRALIDTLVRECREGQGTVLPGWVRRGVWNTYALDHPEEMPEESQLNDVLQRLDEGDRQLVARMVEDAYMGAVHDTLRVLHEAQVPPFDDGYEGAPFYDFMGRLKFDWEWPT